MKVINSKRCRRTNTRAKRIWDFAFISVLGICLCFVICDLVLPHLARAASPTTKPSDKISVLFTKLADRGSHQVLGIVTDVGLFVRELASRLCR